MAKSEVKYDEYLKLPAILGSQELVSEKHGNVIHDEHMFIIVHQATELWFKQLIFELDSIITLFPKYAWHGQETLVIISRLERCVRIVQLVIKQTSMLETMAPGAFMQFRDFLAPASGADSHQFRLIENKLGLQTRFMKEMKTVEGCPYRQQWYKHTFKDDASRKALEDASSGPTLLREIERWLEQTPGLESFIEQYSGAVKQLLNDEYASMTESEESQLKQYDRKCEVFASITDNEKHEKLVESGKRRLSHRAMLAALCINHYRDQPAYQQAFQLLSLLIDIDCWINKWRNTHTLLVQRQIGTRSGTGGTSGHYYLTSTICDDYKVFIDLFNVATFLLPPDYVPELSAEMRTLLSFN